MQISPLLPSQPPQPLSFLDILWLKTSNLVERLYFYDFPHPVSHFMNHNFPIFTKSLSLTLQHYYLFAGSIRPSSASDDQFEIVYMEGDSINITISEFTGVEFHNISGYHPRDLKNLRLLVPKPERSPSTDQFPPISIQITLFPNQGICVGFALNHAVCDGSSLMQFIRSWTAACRSTEPILENFSPPFLDRSIVIDTYRARQKILGMTRQLKEIEEEHLERQSSLVSATFTLGKDEIARLKERVQAKGVELGKPSFHLSGFVVTCAYVWRCLVKAREDDGDIIQFFGCAVDWRSRMLPLIPSNYFGNCLGACVVDVKVRDLVRKDGIEVAAMEIGKRIDDLQGRDVGEVLNAAFDTHVKLAGRRILWVAGSPKLRVYKVDFGWGTPAKVEITSISETGAISLAESRDEEGGVEIGLVLPKEEMIKFGTNFAADLLDL